MLRGWGCAACCLYSQWTAGSRRWKPEQNNGSPADKCDVHTSRRRRHRRPQTQSDRLPEAALAHEPAEMDSLPAQSVWPRLKRSPRRPATPQPLIWIGCAIWIAKRPADRLMHNSKEQAERAAYLGVNSLYFPCNEARPHPSTQTRCRSSDTALRDRGKRPRSTLHPAALNTPDRRCFAPQQSDSPPAGSTAFWLYTLVDEIL